jgi:DNA-binding transcriptional LysR family regulator
MDTLDWNQLKAFLETAETGSLSAAARKLGLTQPTLSRQVAAIEQHMGVTLFERAGKAMALTPTGLDLLEHARAMGAAAEALGLAATGRSQAVGGVVSVSATDAVAAHLLPPLMRQLREKEPGIAIEVVSSDALSDLLRREADIAIRNVKPEQPDLVARLIREAGANFYASEDWVRVHGRLRSRRPVSGLPAPAWPAAQRGELQLLRRQLDGLLGPGAPRHGHRRHGRRNRPRHPGCDPSARRRAARALPDLAGHPPRASHLAADPCRVRGAGAGVGFGQLSHATVFAVRLCDSPARLDDRNWPES